MRNLLLRLLLPVADLALAPVTAAGALLMRLIRWIRVSRLPVTRRVLFGLGIYPLREHYYDPLFNYTRLRHPGAQRALPGLDLNVEGQLRLLSEFTYAAELREIPLERQGEGEFYYHNGWFEAGDAEFLYNMIRRYRPARILEVGGGLSTLMAARALRRNAADDPAYRCEQVCVEPYENPWLERTGIRIIRNRIEELEPARLPALSRHDILFIDSSHVIRPEGDVLHELLRLVPALAPGVFVHLHDVFTPRDYPAARWIEKGPFFDNEQYLLEALLSMNTGLRVVGAVNYLAHEHPDALAAACPVFGRERQEREPGSFWMERV